MIKNITMGQYYPAKSAVHSMDPRMKIFLTLAYIVLVFFVTNFWGYGMLLLFLGVAVALAKVPAGYMLRSLKPLRFILIFTMLLNIFFTKEGKVLVDWWIFTITDEGILRAVFMALRMAFLVAGTCILMLTTSPIALTDGLERLLSPLKVVHFPAHELAMMMTIALRFIPTLLDEADKIMKAQMARGADFESGNLFARAKEHGAADGATLCQRFRRADELAMAMESRCYHGGEGRTRMRVLKLSGGDWIAFFSLAALFAAVVLWG